MFMLCWQNQVQHSGFKALILVYGPQLLVKERKLLSTTQMGGSDSVASMGIEACVS